MRFFGKTVSDTSLKLSGKFYPQPKFAKKEGGEKKEFCLFFLLCPKRGSWL
jgi:hypothetical protein